MRNECKIFEDVKIKLKKSLIDAFESIEDFKVAKSRKITLTIEIKPCYEDNSAMYETVIKTSFPEKPCVAGIISINDQPNLFNILGIAEEK